MSTIFAEIEPLDLNTDVDYAYEDKLEEDHLYYDLMLEVFNIQAVKACSILEHLHNINH
jgi:hypothetical protein